MKFRDYSNYEIYSDGRIFSYKSNKFLKPITMPNGYQVVNLYDNEGKNKMYRLHRVIYETFIGEHIPEGLQVNHIDEDKTNNNISNLNLMTPKENINWGTANLRRGKTISKALTNNTKISKQVGAFQNGKLVMQFPSTIEAQRQGFNQGCISECCNGNRKTHKGYIWKFL